MPGIATQPLHFQYQDSDGSPLENGFLYFGIVNQNPETAPITVYWDAAETQPAAQPIRTLAGFPSRNGKIANVFLSSNYSLTVRNGNSVIVYSERTSGNSFFGYLTSLVLLVSSAGSSLIGFIQAGVGAVLRTIQDKLRDTVNVKDFAAVGDGVTSDAAAFAAAEAALPSDGGTIEIPPGVYLLGAWTPTKHNLNIIGAGRENTRLKCKLNINDIARGSVSKLTLDGYGTQSYTLGFCANAGAGATIWRFEDVTIYGGTADNIYIGDATRNPDVASILFVNCATYGGAFGSVTPTTAQISIAGSNTLLINWIGGVLGGGTHDITVNMILGSFSTYGVQWINSSVYAVDVLGGQFMDWGSHAEGTGGFLRTSASDLQPVASAQTTLVAGQYVNTGATNGGIAILHESPRQIAIMSSFFNEDVKMTSISGRLLGLGNTFGTNNAATRLGKYINTGPGKLLGDAAVASSMGRGFATALSASDVAGPYMAGGAFVVRDTSHGGSALVLFESNITPVIASQAGITTFTTGSPGAAEIQIKAAGVGLGVLFRAGSGVNNTTLSWNVLTADELSG